MSEATAIEPSDLFRGPAAYQPRTPWSPLWGLVGAVIIGGLAFGTMLAGVVLVTFVLGPSVADARVDDDLGLPQLLVLGLGQIAAVILTLLASRLFGGRSADVLALKRPAGTGNIYVQVVLAMLVVEATLGVVEYLVAYEDILRDMRPFADMARGPYWVLGLFVVGLGAPLSEELLFRGFLLSALAKSRLGFGGATVVTCGLWTTLHWGYTLTGLIDVFLGGLFLSWLLWRTGSLRVAILCHGLYNAGSMLVLRYLHWPV